MRTAVLALLLGVPAVNAAAGSLEKAGGIQVAVFELKAGTIYVNLPDDVAPGDTASATVNPVPKGKDAREREKRLEELGRYGIDLAGQSAPASQRVRTFTLPGDARALTVLLLDDRGRKDDEVKASLRDSAPPPAGYEVPPLGQGGSPVRIPGPFDGDLSNSSVRVGDEDAEPIAESPRQLLVRGPREGTGPETVEVRERGAVVATGTYRNVDVQLAAGLTRMRSGQSTTLTITVTGVDDLDETLPIRLANRSPGVVSMEGGEEQTLCVHADEVKDGTWTATRKLTGVSTGGFSIGADVAQPPPPADSWARASGAMQGELRARFLLEQPVRRRTGEELLAGPYDVIVRGAGDDGAVSLLLAAGGEEAGTLPGAVFERLRTMTLCDRSDLSEAAQRAAAGVGEPSFQDLGFEDGASFDVRGGGQDLRLSLANGEEDFSIEADLGTPQ